VIYANVYLVTQDATQYDEGVALHEVLKLANDAKVHEVVVLLDSYFSGTMGNVPVIDNALQKYAQEKAIFAL